MGNGDRSRSDISDSATGNVNNITGVGSGTDNSASGHSSSQSSGVCWSG